MPDDVEHLRAQLLDLRHRRERLERERERLAHDIRTAIRRSRGKVGMSEVARTLGFDRAGLYRTYG